MQKVETKTTLKEKEQDEFTRLYEKNKDKSWFSRLYGGTDPFAKGLVEYRKWYATIYSFNSVPYLEKLDIPIFWIFGDETLDKLGPVKKSIETVNHFKKQGKSYSVNVYKDENHNVKEQKYEMALYQWLSKTNDYQEFKFREH